MNCSEQVLKSLYQLNVEAKKHAESAAEAYDTGWKEQARVHSQKKKALYSLKRAILGEFVRSGCVDEVERHEIDGRVYFCLYVDGFSFHTPQSEWDDPSFAVVESKQLDSFDSTSDSRSDYMNEREALRCLTDRFESPNKHLESPFTHSDYGCNFVGWSSLPGALEEGDRVPEEHLLDRNGEGDFGLEIGDSFQTTEGHCEIVDRYHAYLSPLRDRSPVLQRAVYDVMLDGEQKEAIRERRIIDDWWMIAESIANPLPDVDGKLGDPDYIRGHIESLVDDPIEFEISDMIELQPEGSDEPIYCRISEVHVSYNLLLGDYEPVPPTDEAPLGLSIHEIANDVVAVHDEPPTQD
jgi:hypothetical protein